MPKRLIETDLLMRPIAHFSHAARIGGLIHVGATAGTDAERRLAGDTHGVVDFAAQARRMLANLETVLHLLGAGLDDVVRVKTYITDVRDIAGCRAIYDERFGAGPPNHVIVGSHFFPLPQAALEIDVVAMPGGAITRRPASAGQHAAVLCDGTCFATALPGPHGDAGRVDVAGQAREAIESLRGTLAAEGMALSDVAYTHVTLADARSFAALEAVYRDAFSPPYPARAVVAAPTADPMHALQIEAVAVRGGGRPIGTADQAVLGAASPAMEAGDILYIGGQRGMDDGAGVEAQTRAAWRRLHALIEQAGFPQDSVLRTNSVLTDWRHYAAFNAGYGASVRAPYPPRATVLGGLLDPAAGVQIEAIAHRHGDDAAIVQVPGLA